MHFIHTQRFAKAMQGSISVFLSVVMVATLSLSALLVEGGRLKGSKQELDEATINTAMSLLADYNELLKKRFGLLAMDAGNEDLPKKKTDFERYLQFNSDADASGLYRGTHLSAPYTVSQTNTNLMFDLANKDVLQREILEYEKYRAPVNIAADLLDIEGKIDELLKTIKNNPVVKIFQEFLDMLKVLEKLCTAIKSVYELGRSIQQLQDSVDGGGLTKKILSDVWEILDKTITGAEWKTVSPSLKKRYDDLKNAIKTKTDALKAKETAENASRNADKAQDNAEEALDKAREALAKAEEALNDAEDDAKEDAQKKVETAQKRVETAAEKVDSAVDKADTARKTAAEKAAAVNAADAAITNAIKAYKDGLGEFKELLETYETKLGAISGAIEGVVSAEEAVRADLDKNHKKIDINNDTNPLAQLKKKMEEMVETRAEAGVNSIDNLITTLDNISASTIGKSYTLPGELNPKVEFKDNRYFMSKTVAAAYVSDIAAINLASVFTDTLAQIIDLPKIINPVPSDYDRECTVELQPQTTSLLPSRQGGTVEPPVADDNARVNALLQDTKKLVPEYAADIDKVSPADNNISKTAELEEAIDTIVKSLPKLTKAFAAFVVPAIGLVYLVIKIVTDGLINEMINLFKAFVVVIQHTDELFKAVTNALGNNIALTQYALEMFPNRNETISGCKGYERRLSLPPHPANNILNPPAYQTFSGAQVEYIIEGQDSEISNQKNIYWKIFILRLVNSAVSLFTESGTVTLDIILATTPFSPIVLIIWLYCETTVDMNLLVDLDEKIPLWETTPYLSKDGIEASIERIKKTATNLNDNKYDEDSFKKAIDRTKARMANKSKEVFGKGIGECDYETYLMMFLMTESNETKTMRMADLIQMEMRHAKRKSTGKNFLMREEKTYVRAETTAKFNPVLPILSLGKEGWGNTSIRSTKYVGY